MKPGARHQSAPWYREPWPWLLMAGPALVVVAGMITLWLAVASEDGLVADDYYKRGLAINQTLSRDRAATALDYRAQVMFSPDFGRVRVMFDGAAPGGELVLRIVHPTRAGMDQLVPLATSGAGIYEAALAGPRAGRWRVTLEDKHQTWRLSGEWRVPEQLVLRLTAREEGT